MMRQFEIFALLLLLAAPAIGGEIKVRQGTESDLPTKSDFTSPMILDLPFPDPSRLRPGTVRRYGEETQEYFCDDVAVYDLNLSRGKRSKSSPEILFKIDGLLYVRPSFDRLVDLDLVVLNGETELGRSRLIDIDAEEKKTTPFKTTMALDISAMERALAQGTRPILRLIVVVREE